MTTGERHPTARRIGLKVLGWTLVVAGIAMLVLPGPGLLGLVAGLAILAQQYHWAQKRLGPVRDSAFRAAREGVSTRGRIATSCCGALVIVGAGTVWTVQPGVPGWWPLTEFWWLPGGVAAGVSMIVAGLIALGFIIYSIRRFRTR